MMSILCFTYVFSSVGFFISPVFVFISKLDVCSTIIYQLGNFVKNVTLKNKIEDLHYLTSWIKI
jgi:hypothetical protein